MASSICLPKRTNQASQYQTAPAHIDKLWSWGMSKPYTVERWPTQPGGWATAPAVGLLWLVGIAILWIHIRDDESGWVKITPCFFLETIPGRSSSSSSWGWSWLCHSQPHGEDILRTSPIFWLHPVAGFWTPPSPNFFGIKLLLEGTR